MFKIHETYHHVKRGDLCSRIISVWTVWISRVCMLSFYISYSILVQQNCNCFSSVPVLIFSLISWRTMIYFAHWGPRILLLCYRQDVFSTNVGLSLHPVVFFSMLLIIAHEIHSVSWRASAGGNVVPQGPWKWNLKQKIIQDWNNSLSHTVIQK